MRRVSQQIGWSQESKLYYEWLVQLERLTAILGKNIQPVTTVGDWYLIDDYIPAFGNGWITFPDHLAGAASLNPNEVGQTGGGTDTQIYINVNNSDGQDKSSFLSKLVNQNRILTLTQGTNSVTYSCTFQAFEVDNISGSDEVFADNVFGNSIPGSITILSPASGDFNTVDPITITIV